MAVVDGPRRQTKIGGERLRRKELLHVVHYLKAIT
jgi:hypothetical protein